MEINTCDEITEKLKRRKIKIGNWKLKFEFWSNVVKWSKSTPKQFENNPKRFEDDQHPGWPLTKLLVKQKP